MDEDELDELLAAPVAAVAPLPADEVAVEPSAAVAPLPADEVTVEPAAAVAPVVAVAAVPGAALEEPVIVVPPAVSELSASPLAPPAQTRLAVLTPLPTSSDSPELFESPLPEPLAAYPELEPPPQRSDLRELLNGYLAHTRCEAHMTADLRRMIGLDPWRAPGAVVHRPELGR